MSEQHIFLPRLISQMEPNFVLLFISIKNVFEIRKKTHVLIYSLEYDDQNEFTFFSKAEVNYNI